MTRAGGAELPRSDALCKQGEGTWCRHLFRRAGTGLETWRPNQPQSRALAKAERREPLAAVGVLSVSLLCKQGPD